MYRVLKTVLNMLWLRVRHAREFHHVGWSELLGHLWRRFVDPFRYRHLLRRGETGEWCVETPWGQAYVPKSISAKTLTKLLAEVCDVKHWHYYESDPTLLRQGSTVVDCGSGEGLFALSVADRAGRLILIEPQEEFLPYLRRTFERYADKTNIFCCAVSDVSGSVDLVGEGVGAHVGRGEFTGARKVTASTLDSLLRGQRVDYLKVDVEGHEEQVLAGALRTIGTWKPHIVVAVYHGPNEWRRIVELVRSVVPEYRYKLRGITGLGKPVLLQLWVA